MLHREAPGVAAAPLAMIARADEALTGVRARSGATYVRVRAGLYVARAEWAALPPWHRYLQRVHAYAVGHPSAVFCLESAAVLRGLPVFGEPREIHVLDPGGSRSRRQGDVVLHSSVDERTVAAGPVLTTSVADTAVDLMRVLPPAFALAVADAALRHAGARLTVDDLRELADSQSARRGRQQLGWVWPRATGRSESVGESISRAVLEWGGFPEPELQRWFHGEGVDERVDFFWPRWRVIGESDGYGKYAASGLSPLAALKAEKAREDRLRRQADGFARWDYADAMRFEPLLRKVREAGVPLAHRANTRLLATLRVHPRSLAPSDRASG